MADITNPILVKWIRERLRPASEIQARADYTLDIIADEYTNNIAALLAGADPADVIVEGRGDIADLTIADLNAILSGLNRARNANTEPQRVAIRKGNVRGLRVEFD